jgi:hypothetical protein
VVATGSPWGVTGCRPEVRHGSFVAGLLSRSWSRACRRDRGAPACRTTITIGAAPSRSWCAQCSVVRRVADTSRTTITIGAPAGAPRAADCHNRRQRAQIEACLAAFERRDNAAATTFDWRFTAHSFIRAVRLAAGWPTFRMDNRVQGVHSEHRPNGRIMKAASAVIAARISSASDPVVFALAALRRLAQVVHGRDTSTVERGVLFDRAEAPADGRPVHAGVGFAERGEPSRVGTFTPVRIQRFALPGSP